MLSELVKPVYYRYGSGEVYLKGTFLKVVSRNLGSVVI